MKATRRGFFGMLAASAAAVATAPSRPSMPQKPPTVTLSIDSRKLAEIVLKELPRVIASRGI
jgi:hypothetical protein